MPDTHSLVVMDVSAIQDYVFGTNDLKHHLGASELVRCVTGTWLRRHLPTPNNLPTETMLQRNSTLREDALLDDITLEGGAQTEVIYAGGGNAVVVFADDADQTKARAFMQAVTFQSLLEAPGLQVTLVARSFDWSRDDLNLQIGEALSKDIRQKKQAGLMTGEMLGLSVTADCEFTGLPAVTLYKPKPDEPDEREQRISAEIAAKLDNVSAADRRLSREIGGDDYVRDFDDFGDKGESSYIAVVHTDGNRMGKRFEALACERLPNRIYIQRARALSRSVNGAAEMALKATADSMRNAVDADSKIGGRVASPGGKLPFRPIIFGGDDVTFVCDGRLGLTATARYLETFEKQTLSDGTHPTARAGIAIVKTHFPFGRAYALAEALADSAKKDTDEGEYSAMDWHFGINGVVKGLDAMREQDYCPRERSDLSLLMRPVRLSTGSATWRTWSQFAQLAYALGGEKYSRNKVKAFREALRGGPQEAKRFTASNFPINDNERALPSIPNYISDNGWIGNNSIYFDAIEALDFFVTLEPSKQGVRI
jgi:hypothetical protein